MTNADDRIAIRSRMHASRAETLRLTALYVALLDVDKEWAEVATRVHEAGVPKDRLVLTLSCSASTYQRWMTGQTAPGPNGRRNIRSVLIQLLDELRVEHERLSRSPETV